MAHPQEAGWIELKRSGEHPAAFPLTRERFLIGAGSCCDLQCTAGGFPMVHSVITATGAGLSIDALVPEPWMRVSGRHVRWAELHDGDTVEVWPLSFVLHAGGIVDTALYAPLDVSELIRRSGYDVSESLEALSAAALVDRLEVEIEVQESFEREPWGQLAEVLGGFPKGFPASDSALALHVALERVAQSLMARHVRTPAVIRELKACEELAAELRHRLDGAKNHPTGEPAVRRLSA